MLALAYLRPGEYDALMQEDRLVEWWTAALFLAAAALTAGKAIKARRVGDVLVALFCLFVALEEVSWGQRLLGYTPPAVFLEHNTQQETTLHNFADVFGKPKWVLSAILVGFGVLLPIGARVARTTAFSRQPHLARASARVRRFGLTAPSTALLPWFVIAVVLLVSYPVDFTGEWVETLAGALFFVAAGPSGASLAIGSGLALASALGLTRLSAVRAETEVTRLMCARAEADALLRDLASVDVSTQRFARANRVHKRVWTAATDGYLVWNNAREFHRARCLDAGARRAAQRRRFAIDPWGMPYWLLVEPQGVDQRVAVYSTGPNRRRDGEPGRPDGDDIVSVGLVPAHPTTEPDTTGPVTPR